MSCLGHGVLLVFGAPLPLYQLAGQEHGRTIPLTDLSLQEAVYFCPCSYSARPSSTLARGVVSELRKVSAVECKNDLPLRASCPRPSVSFAAPKSGALPETADGGLRDVFAGRWKWVRLLAYFLP